MLLLTKFIGVIILVFGLFLLMSCYDNETMTPLKTITMGISGFLIIAIGGICWFWCELYEEERE